MTEHHYIPDATDDVGVESLQASQMMLAELAKKFMLAGNATFTLRSKTTSKRFTYKIQKIPDEGRRGWNTHRWWCKLLTGPDNSNDFKYFGMLYGARDGGSYCYVHGKPGKSCAARSSESVKAFTYTVGNIFDRTRIPDGVEFWHAGKCGRCGRKLTDPDSIESGFGPECVTKIGM